MKLIFQIAAGMVIAILLSNIIMQRMVHTQLEEDFQSSGYRNYLMSGANTAQTLFENYLRNHNKLPRFAEDMDCLRTGLTCPEVGEDGAFYFIKQGHWVRMAPRLQGEKLHVDCRVSDKGLLEMGFPFLKNCQLVEDAPTPVLAKPSTACDGANRKHEKRICKSERLYAASRAVENAYQNALDRSVKAPRLRLIADQSQKLKNQLVDCKDDQCLEAVLWARYAKLQQF